MNPETRIKVLAVHNYYAERGGEDESYEGEISLLAANGHVVCQYTRINAEIASYSLRDKVVLPFRAIWSRDTYKTLSVVLNNEKPAVAHFTNTFPLISPAAYDACRNMDVPVIQSLRNYRLVCPNALLFRDGHVCNDCVRRILPWPGVLHACYRESRFQSLIPVTMLTFHNLLDTWATKVDLFIALTDFSRNKFVAGGIPKNKIVVKPNFVFDNGLGEGPGSYAIFVGRLAEGKGLHNLLNAWKLCDNVSLRIIGDGPLHDELQARIQNEGLSNVELCGRLSLNEVSVAIKNARFLVYSSLWYENFPRVLLESFSSGRPVIAADIGTSAEIVENGVTGFLFASGDKNDLAEKINLLWNNQALCAEMGGNARRVYELKYTPENNYKMLIEIYDKALKLKG